MAWRIVRELWSDERGVTSIVDILLVGAIAGVGMIVGLATFRDQVVLHFNDAALALRSLDQSFSITIGTMTSSFADPGPFPAVSEVEFVTSEFE